MKKIGFIGAGNMAGAIIGGIIKSNLVKPQNVIASAKTMTNLEKLKDEYKINVTLDTREVVKNSDTYFMKINYIQLINLSKLIILNFPMYNYTT